MKQTKKLTRNQRTLVEKAGFNTRELRIRLVEETPKYIHILIDNEDKAEFKIPKGE